MQLSHLLALAALTDATIQTTPIHGATDVAITAIAYDTRTVVPGALFVAIKGYHTDGHCYLPQAIERGAHAAVVDEHYITSEMLSMLQRAGVCTIVVPHSRVVLASLAAAFYRFPAHKLGMVGITGTKGKTTTSTLVSHVLDAGGYTTGMMTTVAFKIANRHWENATRQTTPEALDVQTLLHDMVAAQCHYAVVEASSHALSPAWNRVGQCAFDVAVMTNVTHEHLDYHGTLEQYRNDKARLFALLDEVAHEEKSLGYGSKMAIVNADDPHHHLFLAATPSHIPHLTYAINTNNADIHATVTHASPAGTTAHIATPWGVGTLTLTLPGQFNLSNALAAVAVAGSQSIPLATTLAALAEVRHINGRMERIVQGQPFEVIVDYAHNPDSFTQVMALLRPLTHGRMIAVFGSAGERDVDKRAVQGNIAATYCELLILTDEDPRGEDRMAIVQDIVRGVEKAGMQRIHTVQEHGAKHAQQSGYIIELERAAAIHLALQLAAPGDVVLLLGKGHERSIEYADGKCPWHETNHARDALTALGYSYTTQGVHML